MRGSITDNRDKSWPPVMRRAIGLAGIALCVMALLGFSVLLPVPLAQPGLLLTCLVLLAGLAVCILHACTCWAAAAAVLVWGSWAVVMVAMTVTDGLYSPLVPGLPGLLSLCAWIYGPRATLAMLALTLCSVFALLLAPQHWQYFSPYLTSHTALPGHATAQYVLLHLGGILCMTAAGVLLVRRGVIAQSTRMRRAQADLQQQQEELRTFHSAVEQNPHSIVMTDARQRIVYVNQAFLQRSGFAREAVLGQSTLRYSTMGMPPVVRHAAYQRLALGRPWRGKLTNKTCTGEDLTEAVLIAPVRGSSGSITHYVEIKQDLSGHVRAEQQIHDLVHFDALTGLPNRLTLSLRLRALAHGAGGEGGADGSAEVQHGLLLLNMDRFTAFNDAQGMLRGDDLLRAIALRLTESIPARGSLLAHLGADEFAVLLENVGADAAARLHQAAKALQQALLRPLHMGGDDAAAPNHPPPGAQMTCCIGGCLFAAGGSGAQDALRHANLALRQAKLLGPGQILMFNPAMSHAADKRFRTDRELRQAISAGHLRLYLQAQVNAQGQCVGAETLVRWKHPTLGLVPPQDFIPVAEESDAIVLLGDWVLDTACRMLASRQFAGQRWRLSVNVSGRQFCQSDFVDKLRRLLRQTGADAQRLTLEITESVAMSDMQEAHARMLQLRALGVELALDDFGTGYSSLSCLKELPFQELKIDKSFVRDCAASEGAASMVEAILLLAARLGLRVVAEGVETGQQAQTLRAWHPKIVYQGYYYGKPQPARDWLKQQMQQMQPDSPVPEAVIAAT